MSRLDEVLQQLEPPDPALEACVVIPARNERDVLPRTLAALARQVRADGRALAPEAYEAIVLLNNCDDGSFEAVKDDAAAWPDLRLHLVEVQTPPEQANVGFARRLLMETACARFEALSRPSGLLLSTDADTQVAADWVEANLAEIRAGADAIGGRVLLAPSERRELEPMVRRWFLLDVAYYRLAQELESLIDPDPFDPFPHHFQHLGASFGITAQCYRAAGGLPPLPNAEDVALFQAVKRIDGRFRHSYRVRVCASARKTGRAPRGMADALGFWTEQSQQDAAFIVTREAGKSLEELYRLRARLRGLWRNPPRRRRDVEAAASVLCADETELEERLACSSTVGALLEWAEQQWRRVRQPEFAEIGQAVRDLRQQVERLRRLG